jgi:thymidylate synthase
MNNIDKQYQDLLQDILNNGVEKKDRTGTGTISVFGRQIRHKMSEGFPLLTTKKMPWKSIVTELLWFLQGNTNIKWLVDNGCNIWNGDAYKNYVKHNQFNSNPKWLKPIPLENDNNGAELYSIEEFINKIKEDDEFANKWGELGPVYGKQWRSWGNGKKNLINYDLENVKSSDKVKVMDLIRDGGDYSKYDVKVTYQNNSIDQIQNLINDLKTNPDSRRLMVNAWAVQDLPNMVLPPCHYGFQVYTRELSYDEKVEYARSLYGKEDWWNINDERVIEILQSNKRAISLMWNQRSVDTFLGLPFNIASYGLLLEIIAKEVNMVPDELIGNLGDVHLYSNHIEQAKEQLGRKLTFDERTEMLKDKMGIDKYKKELSELVPFGGGMSEFYKYYKIPYETREPYDLPTLKFSPCPITGIDMEYQSIAQFQIENYESHPVIKAPLSN